MSLVGIISRAFSFPISKKAAPLSVREVRLALGKHLNTATPKKRKKEVHMTKEAAKNTSHKNDVVVTVKKKVLGKAPEEHTFVLHDGRKLRTVYELIDEFETMTDDAFSEYVNPHKNDFASWIKDVFDEKGLAAQLERMHNRIEAQRLLLKHLVRELNELVKKK